LRNYKVADLDKDEIISAIGSLGEQINKLEEAVRSVPGAFNSRAVESGYEIVCLSPGIELQLKSIRKVVTDLHEKVQPQLERSEFYYRHLVQERCGYDLFFNDKVTHLEDRFLHSCIDNICIYHNYKATNIEMHKQFNGFEFDCFVTCKTPGNELPRTLGIELKDNNVEKVSDQALKRKDHVNLQYIVLNCSPMWVNDNVDVLKKLKDAGVGLVSLITIEKTVYPVLMLSAKYRKD